MRSPLSKERAPRAISHKLNVPQHQFFHHFQLKCLSILPGFTLRREELNGTLNEIDVYMNAVQAIYNLCVRLDRNTRRVQIEMSLPQYDQHSF